MKKSVYLASMEDLISIPLPEKTRTYTPVPNEKIIDLTLNSIEKAGFKVDSQQYTLVPGGQGSNGLYRISNVNDSEMCLQVGWQNSYDKTMSLKFAIGSHIFICSNGSVYGEMGSFKKKHTQSITEFAPLNIQEYIRRSGEVFEQMIVEREAMKSIEIDTRITAELLGRMVVEDEFINTEQLNIIRKEIKAPSFEYNADGSLWQLYQHTTHALKITHPRYYMQNLITAHDMFSRTMNDFNGYEPAVIDLSFDEENYVAPNQLGIFE